MHLQQIRFLNNCFVFQMIVHRNFETLLEDVPLKYMPKDYGGESPSLTELHGNKLFSIKKV